MSDEAWKMQTKERLPTGVRANVHHNPSMPKVVLALQRLAEMSEDGQLSNVLIILDESHIASAKNNLPNSVYSEVERLCPMNQWQERNIRFLTISATDPAKVLAIHEQTAALPCQVVRLQTNALYQSVESLHTTQRIRFIEDFGDLHLAPAMTELKRVIEERFPAPKYHMIRVRQGKQPVVEGLLHEAFPGCSVILWDSSTKSSNKGSARDASSQPSQMEDINDLLAVEPGVHTFLLLKNMFYAAKTMDDTHVGVLYDRASSKDDTNLQSLLGRACGYGKSKETVVYTSKQTVTNYLNYWKELCQSTRCPPPLRDTPESAKLDNRMGKVRLVRRSEGALGFAVPSGVANPLNSGGAAVGGGAPLKTKESVDENNFTSEWREFATFAEAKAWGKNIREKELVNGFYESTTSKKCVLRYAEVLVMKGGKKTANMPTDMKPGQSRDRLYVGYKDEKDPSSAVFVVRRLTRKPL